MSETMNSQIRHLQERLKASQQEVDQFRALAEELTACCGWVGDKPDLSKWEINRFLATGRA